MGYSSSDSNESTGFLFTRGNRIKSDGWRWRVSYDATNELVKQGELEFDRQINLKELEALYPMTETVSLGVSVSESSDSIVPSSPGLNHDPTFERSSIGINALLEIDLRSYTEIKNYKSVDQTEDLGIGSSIRLSAGVARQRNGTGSGLGLSVGYNYGAHIGQGVFTGGMGISRVDDGQHAVANLTSHIEWIAPLGTSSRFRLRGDAESISGYSFADHLDVGGENGLKGYPNRYQTGPNRLLFVAEYRQDLPYRIWDLGRLGMTFFAESGRAWGDRGEQPWLHNFGAGLIFSPSRSSSTNLVRMELAAPMTDNEELAPVQLFIGAESRF